MTRTRRRTVIAGVGGAGIGAGATALAFHGVRKFRKPRLPKKLPLALRTLQRPLVQRIIQHPLGQKLLKRGLKTDFGQRLVLKLI